MAVVSLSDCLYIYIYILYRLAYIDISLYICVGCVFRPITVFVFLDCFIFLALGHQIKILYVAGCLVGFCRCVLDGLAFLLGFEELQVAPLLELLGADERLVTHNLVESNLCSRLAGWVVGWLGGWLNGFLPACWLLLSEPLGMGSRRISL